MTDASRHSLSRSLLLWSGVSIVAVIGTIILVIRFLMIPSMTDHALMSQTATLAHTIKGVFATPDKWTDATLSIPELLDPLTESGKTVATLFVLKDGDFVRATTTLKKEDGSRALGTTLDRQTEAFKALSANQSYSGPITLFNRPHMATYLPVSLPGGNRGAVFVGVDYSSVDDMIVVAGRMAWVVAIIGLAGAALLLGSLAFTVKLVITQRLNKFRRMAEDLSGGRGDLTRRLDATRKDELGSVAEALNNFLTLLHDMFVKFKSDALQMDGSAKRLSEVVLQTNQQIQTQHDMTERIAAAVEELSVSVDEMSKHAHHNKDASREVAGSTARSMADIASLSGKLDQASGSIGEVTQLTRSFIHDVGQIDNMVTLVSEIADQTNLLALNAAIEAARAGEMGRGFAVVADEVRKLANRSTDTVQMIRATTVRLSGQSDQVSSAVNKSEEALNACVGNMAEVKGSLATIEELAHTLAKHSDDTASMVKEQSVALHDIAKSMESVAGAVESTAHQMNVGSEVAAELQSVSKIMEQTLASFRTN